MHRNGGTILILCLRPLCLLMRICLPIPRSEPVLSVSFPELLPNLRPYQRRAASWMVHRERGLGARLDTHPNTPETGTNTTRNHQSPSTSAVSGTTRCFPDQHPLWFSLLPLDGSDEFFFNPYTYCSPITFSDLQDSTKQFFSVGHVFL